MKAPKPTAGNHINLPMPLNKELTSNSARDQWFEQLVATLGADKFMLDSDVASEDLKDFYGTLIEGNADKLALQSKQISQQHFISKILREYINLIRKNHLSPQKLAFDLNDTEVLVWAEVDDNNEELEKQLILVEAQVNAKYHEFGFDMTSMIVEKSDHLPVPNHYAQFRFKA